MASSLIRKDKNLIGVAELSRKLTELADAKQQAATLRASVRNPMKKVMEKAKANLAGISPPSSGRAARRGGHRLYTGAWVDVGHTLRSIRLVTKMSKDKQMATALLGVRATAFYALQFLELGTSSIGRTPWLEPAFRSSEDAMLKGIADVMRKRYERIAKSRGAGASAGLSGTATGRSGRVI